MVGKLDGYSLVPLLESKNQRLIGIRIGSYFIMLPGGPADSPSITNTPWQESDKETI